MRTKMGTAQGGGRLDSAETGKLPTPAVQVAREKQRVATEPVQPGQAPGPEATAVAEVAWAVLAATVMGAMGAHVGGERVALAAATAAARAAAGEAVVGEVSVAAAVAA